MEYDLNERLTKWNTTSRENGFNGRQLQMTLTLIVVYINENRSQFDLEPGTWEKVFLKKYKKV